MELNRGEPRKKNPLLQIARVKEAGDRPKKASGRGGEKRRHTEGARTHQALRTLESDGDPEGRFLTRNVQKTFVGGKHNGAKGMEDIVGTLGKIIPCPAVLVKRDNRGGTVLNEGKWLSELGVINEFVKIPPEGGPGKEVARTAGPKHNPSGNVG